MGSMGLSYGDFCRLTPGEFRAVCRAHAGRLEAEYRTAWERTRTLAAVCVQPHVKKRLTPQQLLPFPWDKGRATQAHPAPTAEESRQRLERRMRKREGKTSERKAGPPVAPGHPAPETPSQRQPGHEATVQPGTHQEEGIEEST